MWVGPVDGLRIAVSAVSGFAAGAASVRVGRREPAGFAWLERAFCFVGRLVVAVAFFVAFLPGFPALAGPVCSRGALADFAGAARAVLRDAAFGDFLRVFLDIRLPFVAFDGSIIDIAGLVLGEPESDRLVGNSYGLGVWLQGFDAPPVRSLIAPLGSNGE
jgi:hypothetical protein